MREMLVFWANKKVGTIVQGEGGRIEFTYDNDWLVEGQAISLSLPLKKETYHNEAHNFFANLLPEGDFRKQIETIYQITNGNDYSLLNRIGGDCAGALNIGEAIVFGEDEYYEEIGSGGIKEYIETGGVSAYHGNQDTRLSLAGAQGKLPVRYESGKIFIPHKGAASTHIIKFNRLDKLYPKLIENEYFMTRVAFHLGLPVIDCEILSYDGQRLFISKRYDRKNIGKWPERIHQEDICQALAYPFYSKYEKEGGPSLAIVIDLARKKMDLRTVQFLIKWQIFNILTGNSDGHSKNLSILHENNTVKLAPFYDLVCTRAYPKIDRRLALFFGEESDPDILGTQHIEQFSRSTKTVDRYLVGLIREMKTELPQSIEKSIEDLDKIGIKAKELQQVITTVRKLGRKVFQGLE